MDKASDSVESLGVARDKKHFELGDFFPDGIKGCEKEFLLRGMSGSDDENGVVIAFGIGEFLCWGVEFEVAGDEEFFLGDAKREETVEVAFALDAEAVEGCEEASGEKGQFLEAPTRAFGDFAVDESDVHSPFFSQCEEMVPKVAFAEDECGGFDLVEQTADSPRKIKWEIEMRMGVWHAAFGFSLAGLGCG